MSHPTVLRCPACDNDEPCGPSEMIRRLHSLGMLKREKEPNLELVTQLFEARLELFRCSECGHQGLVLAEADDWDDEDWGQARNCEGCGEAITPERLEVFPDTRLCVECQRSDERGATAEEAEYCPRCGAIMEMRSSSARGLTRYVLYCPDCRCRVG